MGDNRITRLADLDAVDKLLFCGIIFFTFMLIAISKWSPNDGQTFQVVSGLLTGFGAAFFARMKPTGKQDSQASASIPPTLAETKKENGSN